MENNRNIANSWKFSQNSYSKRTETETKLQREEERKKEMGWIGDSIESIRSMQIRQFLTQAVSLGSSLSPFSLRFFFFCQNYCSCMLVRILSVCKIDEKIIKFEIFYFAIGISDKWVCEIKNRIFIGCLMCQFWIFDFLPGKLIAIE